MMKSVAPLWPTLRQAAQCLEVASAVERISEDATGKKDVQDILLVGYRVGSFHIRLYDFTGRAVPRSKAVRSSSWRKGLLM